MQIYHPSKEFIAFAQASVLSDAERPFKEPSDIFERKLWDAAGYDYFLQTGQFVRLVDDGGLPKDEACAYKSLIEIAQQIKASSGSGTSASWDEHLRRFPISAI